LSESGIFTELSVLLLYVKVVQPVRDKGILNITEST